MEITDITWGWWLAILLPCIPLVINIYKIERGKVSERDGWFDGKFGSSKQSSSAGIVSSIIFLLIVLGCMVFHYNHYYDYSPAIEKAIEKQDFAKAHKKLEVQYKTIQKGGGINKDEKMEELYEPYALKLFKAELNYLMADDSHANVDRVITLIGDFRIYGTPIVGVTDVKKVIKNNESYMKSVARFNSTLDGVLSQAIAQGNQYLAESILPLYKTNMRKTLHDSHVFNSDEYSFELTNEAQKHAEDIFNKAIKDKKFKKKK